jgi:hypothetical protein
VLCIPANMPHEAWALEDTLDPDVFTPPRADWPTDRRIPPPRPLTFPNHPIAIRRATLKVVGHPIECSLSARHSLIFVDKRPSSCLPLLRWPAPACWVRPLRTAK